MPVKLGKIEKVELGFGGYDDAMFGFSFSLGDGHWGVGAFWGTWATHRSLQEQHMEFLNALLKVRDLLSAAKKKNLNELVGVPVEVRFAADGTLESWRILTEVI